MNGTYSPNLLSYNNQGRSQFLVWGVIWAKKIAGPKNVWGGLKKCQRKKIPPAAKICFETNLANNISPSPKGLMGFISFWGAIFLFWGGRLSPLNPCLATSLAVKQHIPNT